MLLRFLKEAAALPFQDNVYSIRYGVARGLKRRGGLGFLARHRPLSVEETFLTQMPLHGCTVYDVGCLEGLYTLFLARAVGRDGRVVAFEPNPANCRVIRDNVTLNGFRNVQLHEVGLGARRAQAELVVPFGFPGQGTVRDDLQRHYLRQAGTVRVPVRIEPLDELMGAKALPPPDVIKIDVEGLELDVLQGAVKTLRTFKPRLFVELHGLEDRDRALNVLQILNLLGTVGYGSPVHVESGKTIGAAVQPPYEGHLWFS